MILYLKLFVLFILTTGLSSRFYSTRYTAEYKIRPQVDIEKTDKEIKSSIHKLSENHELLTDDKYNETDTLGYFGTPYHYFKFWTSKQDTVITLTLKYNGAFGSRKSPPYQNMLNKLSEHLSSKFNLLESEINEESNRKLKKTNPTRQLGLAIRKRSPFARFAFLSFITIF